MQLGLVGMGHTMRERLRAARHAVTGFNPRLGRHTATTAAGPSGATGETAGPSGG